MKIHFQLILPRLIFSISVWSTAHGHGYADLEPEFAERINNVTAVVGEDIDLSCMVENLGSFRVAWIRVESQTILTIHTHVITRNYRITLNHRDHQVFSLHIAGVQESDRGSYMCQVNTVPMKKQVGYLEVVVPPQFENSDKSGEVLAREGSNVTLSCTVRGHPRPRVTWRREDGHKFQIGTPDNKHQFESFEGEDVSIAKVSRLHMGGYLCSAENGVPPPASKRMQLYVHFPPMLWIPNQLIGGAMGGLVVLECLVEAFPKSLNYWTRHDGQLLVSGERSTVAVQETGYKMHMKLTLKGLVKGDFGTYHCLARNSLGSTEGSIRLYETIDPHSTSTTKADFVEERLEMLDDSLSRERNFPNQSPVKEPTGTEDARVSRGTSTSYLLFYEFVFIYIVLILLR